MQSGTLRTPLTLYQRVVTQNESGEDVLQWQRAGIYWSNISPMTGAGREMARAGQQWGDTRYRITARFRPDITIQQSDCFAWGQRLLDIIEVEDADQRCAQLQIVARVIENNTVDAKLRSIIE